MLSKVVPAVFCFLLSAAQVLFVTSSFFPFQMLELMLMALGWRRGISENAEVIFYDYTNFKSVERSTDTVCRSNRIFGNASKCPRQSIHQGQFYKKSSSVQLCNKWLQAAAGSRQGQLRVPSVAWVESTRATSLCIVCLNVFQIAQ